jgi:hypothetical protein
MPEEDRQEDTEARGRRNRQATDSNPRGLDARAFAEETGVLENCAWNTS